MIYRTVIRKRAELDIADAISWYARQRLELGDDFLEEVETAIASAAENPFHHTCFRRRPEVRRVLTRRFPYRVYFIRRRKEIVVFRVLHAARDDREWKSAINED